MSKTPTTPLIGSVDACERLDCDRSTLSRLVAMGRLPLAMRLPGVNGALLFHPKDVDALAKKRGPRRRAARRASA